MAGDVQATNPANGAQASTPNDEAGQVQAASTVSVSKAEFDALQAKLADLETRENREAAAQRHAKKEALAKAEAAARESGEFKTLAEQLKARVAELEPLVGPAAKYTEYEARKIAEFKKVRDEMSEPFQEALDAAPTLEAQRAVIRAFRATSNQPTVQQKQQFTPPKSPTPAGPQPDFARAMQDEAYFGELMQRSPNELNAYIRGSEVAPAMSSQDMRFARK